MLIFNLCYAPCSIQFLTYYAHVKDLYLNLTVLLEYIHLYHKNFNMVTVLLQYIKVLHTTATQIIIMVDVLTHISFYI